MSRGVSLRRDDATPHNTSFTVISLVPSGPDIPLLSPSEAILRISPISVNEEWEMAICEWLRIQKPDFYEDGIFKLRPKRDKFIDMSENYAEK